MIRIISGLNRKLRRAMIGSQAVKIGFAESYFHPGGGNLRSVLVILLAAMCTSCGSTGSNTLTSAPQTPGPRDPAAICRSMAPDDPYIEEADQAEDIYMACRKAVESSPNDPDIVYLAATSAMETNRTEEALEGFLKAEQLGNCNALYFLGDFALHVQKDLEAAEKFYSSGAACGDERAEWELFSPAVYEKSAKPRLAAALYNSDLETLNQVRIVSASYVYGFYKELGEQYLGEKFSPCWKVTHYRGGDILTDLQGAEKGDATNILEGRTYDWALPYLFEAMYPALGPKALEERREAQREAGKADLLRLVESSNCDSLVAFKFVKGVEAFAKKKKSLLEWGREAAPNLRSVTDLPDLIRNGELRIEEQ